MDAIYSDLLLKLLWEFCSQALYSIFKTESELVEDLRMVINVCWCVCVCVCDSPSLSFTHTVDILPSTLEAKPHLRRRPL